MATVTGYTAAKMQEIEDSTVVDGSVVGGSLILETRDGTPIDAGSVVGPTGPPGTNGTNGTNGAVGPAGAMDMVGTPVQITTAGSLMSVSGVIPGLVKNNVPVIISHTYGIKTDFIVQLDSVVDDATWDFWLRLNGANLDRFMPLRTNSGGTSYEHIHGEVFWTAPATQATDDFDVFAGKVTVGSNITPSGSATLKRKLWIVDYGIV